MGELTESPVWAVTAYFPLDDPPGEKRRLHAFREFRRRLQAPLVAVELSLDGSRFDLTEADADIVLHVSGGDILWQKERLLNLALDALPPHCDTVAWVDGDVVFERDDWPQAARSALDVAGLVQLFHRIHLLDRDETPERRIGGAETPERVSVVAAGPAAAASRLRRTPGFAWAARRSLLERHGFYDALILGGGDRAMFFAACGQVAKALEMASMSPALSEHYIDWASGFGRDVNGRLAHLDGDAFHLWHGDLRFRNYRGRYQDFERFEFDPAVDLTQDPSGLWRWASDKPALHHWVRDFFEGRKR